MCHSQMSLSSGCHVFVYMMAYIKSQVATISGLDIQLGFLIVDSCHWACPMVKG